MLALIVTVAPSPGLAQPASDRTASLEHLGNPGRMSYPTEDKAFARNVWDLKAFGGHLYVGLGNRDNSGPAPNAGPVDIWYLETDTGKFIKEWSAPDEQVEVFRVIDGQLVVPGNDPQESWELGNFYRREPRGWQKVRTIPNAVHNFDMIKFGSTLYAALGTEHGAVVAASTDNGATWREHRLQPNAGDFIARAWSFLVVAGRLHVSTYGREGNLVYVLSGENFQIETSRSFYPVSDRRDVIAQSAVSFLDNSVYLAARITASHPMPIGLVVAPKSGDARAVTLPNMALPRDVTVVGDRLFVLGSRRQGPAFVTYVFETRDLSVWRELFYFRSPTFARSFEIVGSDVYFGLGSTNTDVRPQTGDILRVRGAITNGS